MRLNDFIQFLMQLQAKGCGNFKVVMADYEKVVVPVAIPKEKVVIITDREP